MWHTSAQPFPLMCLYLSLCVFSAYYQSFASLSLGKTEICWNTQLRHALSFMPRQAVDHQQHRQPISRPSEMWEGEGLQRGTTTKVKLYLCASKRQATDSTHPLTFKITSLQGSLKLKNTQIRLQLQVSAALTCVISTWLTSHALDRQQSLPTLKMMFRILVVNWGFLCSPSTLLTVKQKTKAP